MLSLRIINGQSELKGSADGNQTTGSATGHGPKATNACVTGPRRQDRDPEKSGGLYRFRQHLSWSRNFRLSPPLPR